MIRMKTAYTAEIDDEKAAVDEIAQQLALSGAEAASRLCVVHCHREFCETDIFEKISRCLDSQTRAHVPICGITTASSSTQGFKGDMGLTLCLLESADVRFTPHYAPALSLETISADIDILCAPFCADGSQPGLLLGYFPVIGELSGERMIAEIDKRTGGIPLFGGLASSESAVSQMSGVIYEGKMYNAGAVLIGVYGEAKPEFFTANVLASDIVPLEDTVTKAQGNVLLEIGGLKALEYLQSSGCVSGNDTLMMHAIPLVFTLEDGSQIIRNPVTANLETGEITMTGEVPERASIGLAIFNSDVVKKSAEEGLRHVRERAEGRAVFVYSCMVRRWLLLGQPEAEQELVRDVLGDSIPYAFAYVGGEVFPTPASGGRLVNRLQNESLIVCVL